VRVAPAVFRSLGRAVTATDYEALALAFPGVGKVIARAAAWNTVTLHLALADGGEMSDIHRDELRTYFEDKRPISVTIDFRNATYVPVYLAATVDVLPYYSPTGMTDEIRRAVRAVLAFDAVEFDRPVYLSRFYEVIEAVDGVAGVVITEFRPDRGDGQPMVVPTGKITPAGPQLLRAGHADGILLELRA
jgi:hypothetical protein